MATDVGEKMFKAVVVSPEALVLEATVREVEVPASDGMLGVLTHRAPLLTKLGTGVLTLETADGGERRFFVDGGYAQMKDNVLTILTDEAVAAEKLTAAMREAEEAKLATVTGTDKVSMERRDALHRRVGAMGKLLEAGAGA